MQGRRFCKGAIMSRVLITGASGLVGSHLLRMLVDEPRAARCR
ncbi:Oxidoreductase [Cronobacter dublinensis 582]|nr:Oxidoreductase [Cronobacter dublinensis 582]